MRDISTKIDNTAPAPSGRLSADEFNSIQVEAEHLVSTAGLTLDASGGPDSDLFMKAQAVARYASGGVFCQDSGSAANLYVLASPNGFRLPKAYFTGMRVLWYPGHGSTGAAQISVNAIGAKSLLDHTGTAFVGGEMVTGRLADAVYDEAAASGAGAFRLAPWANALLFSSPGTVTTTIAFQNLPIYPEITSSGNVFTFSTGTGQVVVGSGVSWLWRGWQSVASSDISSGARTFATTALKTYHLRWHAPGTGTATPSSTYPNGRFVLQDIANSGYNPSSLAETDIAFDTSYDDMLIARIVTDSGNTPTVTALINKARLQNEVRPGADQYFARNSASNGNLLAPFATITLDWARTPKVMMQCRLSTYTSTPSVPREESWLTPWGTSGTDGSGTVTAVLNRYVCTPVGQIDINIANFSGYPAYWQLSGLMIG